MHKVTTFILCLAFAVSSFTIVQPAQAAVHVKGYFRSNGTYVQPHYRSNPDGNPYNNWSFPGNTNPYTGKVAPGNPSTYLNDYYKLPSIPSPTYYSPYIDSILSPITTCPVNAYYSYLDSACKCNAGTYSVGGKCVDQESACKSQYGIYSEPGSDGDKCKCSTGYVFNLGGSQCVPMTTENSCVDKVNSYLATDYKCYCRQGFIWNTESNSCTIPSAFHATYPKNFQTNTLNADDVSNVPSVVITKDARKIYVSWSVSDPSNIDHYEFDFDSIEFPNSFEDAKQLGQLTKTYETSKTYTRLNYRIGKYFNFGIEAVYKDGSVSAASITKLKF